MAIATLAAAYRRLCEDNQNIKATFMSKQMPEALKIRFEKITPKVIAKYFSEKGFKPKCSQCGATNYVATTYESSDTGTDGKNHRILEVFEWSGVNVEPPTQLKVYPLLCRNCGTIWNIDALRILEWKEISDGIEADSNESHVLDEDEEEHE